jgi:NAD(P)-dependent dehydrogenase (short-subunit alcohol dehydrogenase family)
MTKSTNQPKTRHAFISGASRGIGASIAYALAQEGIKLTLTGRNLKDLEEQAKSLSALCSVQVLTMDLENPASVQSAIDESIATFGAVNILINNAGQAISQPFVKTDLSLWKKMVDINLTGSYLCISACLPSMLQAAKDGQSGRIINIASTAGLIGYPYVSAYTAAKHGVIGLTKSLALELANKNITVNAVCPGYTETDIVRDAIQNIVAKTGKSESEAKTALAASNPQGRLIQPIEVAQTVAWLCAPNSASINGQSIAVDGGETAA